MEQRKYIEKIKSDFEKSTGKKIPLTEIVRRALDAGLPIIEKQQHISSKDGWRYNVKQ